MVFPLICFVIMVCIVFWQYKKAQQKFQQKEQERKQQEEKRRKEEELALQQLEDCKKKWRESALYKIIFPQIKEVLIRHLHSVKNKYSNEKQNECLIMKVREYNITIDMCIVSLDYELDLSPAYVTNFSYSFNDNGYKNIKDYEVKALRDIIASDLEPWIKTTDILMQSSGEDCIRFYYNKCYKDKKSVFTH